MPDLPKPRPLPAVLFSAAPIFMALFLVVSVGTLTILAWRGGHASGARVVMVFQGACDAQQWAPLLVERADEIGLGNPQLATDGNQARLTATLPGLDDDSHAIPALLARTGQLELRLEEALLAQHSDSVSAQLSIDEAGQPYTELVFTPEATARIAQSGEGEELFTTIDGEPRTTWQSPETLRVNKVRMLVGGDGNRVRMRAAADDAIVLTYGPLPCAVQVDGVVSAP